MKKWLRLSIAFNCLFIFCLFIVFFRNGVITNNYVDNKENTKVEESSYHDKNQTNHDNERNNLHLYLKNTQYNAYLSMFELNKNDTDVVFVGDSLTARGAYDEFFDYISVLNRGIGSDIAEGMYNRIEEIISHHPKQIFVMIGINDIAKEIPVDEFLLYYKKTIEQIKKDLPDCTIFIESILPTETLDNSIIQLYNLQIKNMCYEYNIEYIDLYSMFLDEDGNTNEELLSEDGIHLNGYGYRVIVDEIRKRLSK